MTDIIWQKAFKVVLLLGAYWLNMTVQTHTIQRGWICAVVQGPVLKVKHERALQQRVATTFMTQGSRTRKATKGAAELCFSLAISQCTCIVVYNMHTPKYCRLFGLPLYVHKYVQHDCDVMKVKALGVWHSEQEGRVGGRGQGRGHTLQNDMNNCGITFF